PSSGSPRCSSRPAKPSSSPTRPPRRRTSTPPSRSRWRHDRHQRRRQRHRTRPGRADHGLSRVRPRLPGEALMTAAGWLQLLVLLALLAIYTPLLGAYTAKVYGAAEGGNRRAPGDRIFLPVERAVYRICRVDPEREQRWTVYAYSLLAFSAVSGIVLYVQLRLQGHLLLNPDG